ncbi:MAG: DUF4912 domain-containing protein [Spirochaetaceae bacterium]|jgi:hypothetical protein|nr:DUF4912 domain-containing protein [Spirochaetaceae bacterium]
MGRDAAGFKLYLESLTTRELFTMADASGIDVPPDLDRPFIIRELLDAEFEEDVSQPLSEAPELVTAPLPRQYHITYLEVLPRDPQWVYAFWEIKALDRETCERSSRFEGYELRIMELADPKPVESFVVPVGLNDNSWYLGFPPGDGNFRLELRARGLDRILTVSRPFTLPRFFNGPENKDILACPLLWLSGAADLIILRNADGVSRFRS